MLHSIEKGLIHYFLMAAALASASARTSQITSLNGTWEFAFAADATAPQQRTAEMPNLYRLTVEPAQGGSVTHARTSAVGIRQISTAGGVLRINGR